MLGLHVDIIDMILFCTGAACGMAAATLILWVFQA